MSKEQLSDILAELALDPVMFVETMLQVKPEKWQKKFLQNVMENPRCAVKSGHGVGKTALVDVILNFDQYAITEGGTESIYNANVNKIYTKVFINEIKSFIF